MSSSSGKFERRITFSPPKKNEQEKKRRRIAFAPKANYRSDARVLFHPLPYNSMGTVGQKTQTDIWLMNHRPKSFNVANFVFVCRPPSNRSSAIQNLKFASLWIIVDHMKQIISRLRSRSLWEQLCSQISDFCLRSQVRQFGSSSAPKPSFRLFWSRLSSRFGSGSFYLKKQKKIIKKKKQLSTLDEENLERNGN